MQVQKKIEKYNKLGYNTLPLCMAKTSNSLTGDPSIKGAPTDFTLNITDIFVSVGAGFIVPMVGEVSILNYKIFYIICNYNIIFPDNDDARSFYKAKHL